ncbi:hypothetical protein [Serratia plymuthica]|jgi:hypothetical protein|uniref:hypothetical protein n=1 Tax=Serratia plymuthica TaxID=82996 RepID=UPI0009373EB9|nr:hypothetical protein [Serratia plymuthica]OJT38317.1 hypothetical protein BSR04_18640 [Serratia plymuthica]
MQFKQVLFALSLLVPMATIAAPKGFVDPTGFKGTEAEKQAVIGYIQAKTKKDMQSVGMDNPATLRMMEKTNLDAFKKLTEATDKKLLKKVIKTYCDQIDMCTYQNLQMMYDRDLDASKQNLSW